MKNIMPHMFPDLSMYRRLYMSTTIWVYWRDPIMRIVSYQSEKCVYFKICIGYMSKTV